MTVENDLPTLPTAGNSAIVLFIAYWLALAIGLAVVAEWLGSLLGRENRLGARLTGAALLIALMLVPVIGLFVMGAVMLVALGTGACILPLQRVGMRSASLPSH